MEQAKDVDILPLVLKFQKVPMYKNSPKNAGLFHICGTNEFLEIEFINVDVNIVVRNRSMRLNNFTNR